MKKRKPATGKTHGFPRRDIARFGQYLRGLHSGESQCDFEVSREISFPLLSSLRHLTHTPTGSTTSWTRHRGPIYFFY